MHSIKAVLFLILSITFLSCGHSGQKKTKLSISTNADKNVFTLGDTVKLSLNNPDGLDISAITYSIEDEEVSEAFKLDDEKLGQYKIVAKVNLGASSKDVTTQITILNNEPPKVYGYKIVNTYPHDIASYTQGLEFYNGELYESTGQYKESKLQKINYKTGEVINAIALADQYFAEGLTILNDRIYQLTWQERIGFIYDVNTFKKISSFKYGKSKEGWGLCNNGSEIFKSDGTEQLWVLNKETLAEERKLQVYTNKGKIIGLNELEYINGKIYANRYQKNGVAIINPANGAIEGVIDFSPLHKSVTKHAGLDVLNGIAYNPNTNTIFVTGKRWDKLFEVEVFEN